MRYGLLGEKLGHSFSKEIHEALGRYSYELIEVSRGRLDEFMSRREFDGINVTIPYKQAVIPYLHEVSGRARAIGAVNTIVNRDGKLYGDNTDFGGLKALIEHMGLDLDGKKVLIAGTGGTSKTARAAAENKGASEIIRLSRTGREDALTYEEAYELHPDADILINTTPCGMYPDVEGMPLELEHFEQLSGVVDVVYNPLTTNLVRRARELGIPAENGLYMLVAQAVLAARLFTGESFPQGYIPKIYEELRTRLRCIVLIGMPGCGKTTIGKLLAQQLGRSFRDTDAEIIRGAGMEITEIFRERGETVFRDLETEVLRALARPDGRVIATGGGTVLREKNVEAMKRSGVVVFLDRPLEDLTPTDDRPLSDDADKLRALYAERLPIYRAAADLTVPVRGEPEDVVKEIMEKLK